jgi:hypothetical protein
MICPFSKDCVRADLRTAFAVDAQVLMIGKGGFCIRIEHQITPIRRVKPNAMPRITPETAINVITGMYRKISFLTPVREVNVVEPVKFRDRYAVTAGIMRSGVIADASLAHPGSDVSEKNAPATGIAPIPPRRKPFVEKSFVGMKGSRRGNSTVPATTAKTAASAATGPARNQSPAVTTIAGTAM